MLPEYILLDVFANDKYIKRYYDKNTKYYIRDNLIFLITDIINKINYTITADELFNLIIQNIKYSELDDEYEPINIKLRYILELTTTKSSLKVLLLSQDNIYSTLYKTEYKSEFNINFI